MSKSHELCSLLGSPSPWIMGILNVTPDSFSDGGRYLDPVLALQHASDMLAAGAAIVDVGAESTRPGSQAISAAEELLRLQEIVPKLSVRCIVSVDTYKAEVADWCLAQGARIINDVSALRADTDMAKVIAKHHAFVVLMHSKESGPLPHASECSREYQDVIAEVLSFFAERIDMCRAAGIATNKIILDPGMGKFVSLNAKYSWELLQRFAELPAALPYHWLIGVSRKGFLGTHHSQRDALSALAALHAICAGASIVRAHDISLTASFLRTAQLLKGRQASVE